MHPFIGRKVPGVSPTVGRLTMRSTPFGFIMSLRDDMTLSSVKEIVNKTKIGD